MLYCISFLNTLNAYINSRAVYKLSISGYRVIATVFGLGAWMILVVKATSAIVMAILSLQLYSGLVTV